MTINGEIPDNAINDKLTVINGELFFSTMMGIGGFNGPLYEL